MKSKQIFFNLSLLFLSVVILALEIAQMKLFAFSLQFFVIHIVLSIVLLGFGISGTFYSILRIKSEESLKKISEILLFLLPIIIFMSTKYFCWIAPKINVFEQGGFIKLLILVSILTVPYLFIGLILAVMFTLSIDRIGITYFFNLIGSAIGCIIVFPILRTLGMEVLLLLLCSLLFFSYSFLKISFKQEFLKDKGIIYIGFIFGILLIILTPFAKSVFNFPPDANDQFSSIKKEIERIEKKEITPTLEFSKWDPAGKIEIYKFPGDYLKIPDPIDVRWYCQDSGAGSILFNFGDDFQKGKRFFEQTIYGFAYTIAEKPRTLVIGLGGGVDIQTALYFGAPEVEGVEINKAAVEAISGPYNDFVGKIYNRPNVKIHSLDGRTYIWKNKNKFDLIQITGADTKNFWNTNALALNINFLYTIESFTDYLNSLNNNGVLSITRFAYDLMRLAPIAVATLREMGIPNPENNIIITYQGIWGNILIKKNAFTPEEINKIYKHIDEHNSQPDKWVEVTWFNLIGFGLDKAFELNYEPNYLNKPEIKNQYADFFRAVQKGEEQKFLDSTHNNFYPTTDDNPFFFMQVRFRDIFSKQAIYIKIYVIFTILVLLVAAIFSIVPLFIFSKGGLKTEGSVFLLIYFFTIGVGFMFIEIGLMQILTRFLGSPLYSVSIVLFTLLLFSGFGSYFSNKFANKSKLVTIAITLFAIYTLIFIFGMKPLLNSLITTNLFLRGIFVICLLAPIGFALGIPFPSGLSLLKEKEKNFIPWAVGVNGFASVLGSLSFILLVMGMGFKISLIIGCIVYILAMVSINLFKSNLQKH